MEGGRVGGGQQIVVSPLPLRVTCPSVSKEDSGGRKGDSLLKIVPQDIGPGRKYYGI